MDADLIYGIAAKYQFSNLSRARMLRELKAVADFLAEQRLIAREMSLSELVSCACN